MISKVLCRQHHRVTNLVLKEKDCEDVIVISPTNGTYTTPLLGEDMSFLTRYTCVKTVFLK